MTFEGVWRIYFNRHGADTQPWCVAPLNGAWEICVQSVSIETVSWTGYKKKETADEDDGKPSAVIICVGKLFINYDKGTASITS